MKTRASKRLDGKYNCLAKTSPTGMGYALCANIAKHDPDEEGNPTKCGVHSSAGMARRRERRERRYEEFSAAADARVNRQKHERKLRDIVEAIAAGHNDPRSLCQEWLDEWDRLK